MSNVIKKIVQHFRSYKDEIEFKISKSDSERILDLQIIIDFSYRFFVC